MSTPPPVPEGGIQILITCADAELTVRTLEALTELLGAEHTPATLQRVATSRPDTHRPADDNVVPFHSAKKA